MEKSITELYRQWFDITYPPIGQIRSQYRERRLEEGISGGNLADAVLTLGENEYLHIHDGDFWDKAMEFNKYKSSYGAIILNTPEKWKKFGPELNLNRSSITIKDSKKYRFVPERKMGELYENGKKVKLFGYQDLKWDPEDDYRGVGWYGATTKTHHIVLFDAFVEGQLFADLCEGKINPMYDKSDIYVEVESLSRAGKEYPIKMITTPTSLNEYWFYTEWQDIKGSGCTCPDAAFREMGKRYKRMESWEKLHKYTKGEFVMCRHWAGTYTKQTRDSRKFRNVEEGGVILVDLFPFPREIMFKSYDVLKNRSVKLTDKGNRRLTKGDIGSALGKIIAYLGGFSSAFVFPQEPYSDTVIRKRKIKGS